ncbi:MAG: ABC transporter ATP-binding protein [bacterium]
MASLKVNIKKKLHDFHLTADWSARGNITCLFGYTGSGKSLTLKTIAGLMKPDHGYIHFHNTIFFDSDRRIDLPPQKRDIGFVFQNNMLFPHMTVYQNILYGLSGTGNNKKKKIGDILKIFRLDSLENKYPHQISGGQQQRTAIARAVMRGPKLLLLDEPFNSLDYAVKVKMHQNILLYREYFDIPIILITHDIDELRCLADWIVLYNEGQVEQEGTPEEIFLMPKNRTSARLVATKNIFDAEVVRIHDGLAEVRTERIRLSATINDEMSRIRTGDKVICCIRPEHISLAGNGTSTESGGANESGRINTMAGAVVDFMRNATSYDVFFRIEGRNYDLENGRYDFELKARVEDFVNLGLAKGQKATITIDKNMIYLMKR